MSEVFTLTRRPWWSTLMRRCRSWDACGLLVASSRTAGRSPEPRNVFRSRGPQRNGGRSATDKRSGARPPRTAFAVLRMMLDTEVRDGVVTQNVASTIARPKVDRQETGCLSPAELLSVLDGHRLEPSRAPARQHRTEDLLGPRAALDRPGPQRATAPGDWHRPSGRWPSRADRAKSQRSRRTLPLSPALVEALPSRRKGAGSRAAPGGDLMDGDQPWGLDHQARPTARPAERCPGFTGESRRCRRRRATALPPVPALRSLCQLASGAVSVRAVSEVLGHSSTSITAHTHGHVMDSAKAHALGVVDDVLWVNCRPKLPHNNCRGPVPIVGLGL